MADAAEVQPLPDEEPIAETPQNDDSAAADQPGKDVSFGTFLTVGPKATRDVTIIGYDRLRDSVRAVRRAGNSVENIQIPYDQYKTLIEAQRASDLASGRKTKKNLSKAVSGYFGKSVSLDGKSAQVIGYDAQSDEVLVSEGSESRWMKSGDMLRGTQNLSRNPLTTSVPTENVSSQAKPRDLRVIQEQGQEIDEDKTAQIQRAFEQGRITVQDGPGQRTVGLSVDASGKVLRQVETSLPSIEPAQINFVSSRGETIALTDVDVAIPEITAPINVNAEISVEAPASVPAPAVSIKATRESLKQQRAGAAKTAGGTAAAVAAIAASIPAANTNAAAVMSAAQSVLAAYDASAAARETQIQQISGQIAEVSSRINDLQQRSRQSLAAGNGAQASQYEKQMIQAQTERASLLDQQTDLQITRINETNKAAQIVEVVRKIKPSADGSIPDEQIEAVQRMLPKTVSLVPPAPSASAALPKPPAVSPRAFAPGIPSRRTSAAVSPSVRTPKPLRPLGGSLSTIGGQAQRAVDLNAGQAYDRGTRNGFSDAGAEEVLSADAYESAFSTEGGLEPFSGPLDSSQAQVQTYVAGADDEEPEPADIYGAREQAGKEEMKRIHAAGAGAESYGRLQQDTQPQDTGPVREQRTVPISTPSPTGPSPEEIARASALQQAVAQAVQQQSQQQQEQATGQASISEEEKNKQIQNAKKTISNLVDAFDAAHGIGDVVGILMTVAHINGRLLLTIFKKDMPFFPKAGYPFECTAFACLDLMVCIVAIEAMIVPIVIIAAIIAAVSGATFGLSELVDLF